MLRQPTDETPYPLAFGAEVVIPIEADLDVLHTNDSTELAFALVELDEKRDRVVVQMAEYQ